MRVFWQRIAATLTPGVRILLILLASVYLLALIGKAAHIMDLYSWLPVRASDFWHGQIWRIVTYAFLPASFLDFAMNAFVLVLLGSMLERHWTRTELWLYFGVVAAGSGFTAVLLATPLAGAAPVMFALLVAWAFVSGHEIARFPIFGEITVWRMVVSLAVISFLVMAFSAGLTTALTMTSGGLTGWLYLWLGHKRLMTQGSRTFQSERINRLEL